MKNRTIHQDEIDRELSRAFFGGASGHKKHEKDAAAPSAAPAPAKRINMTAVYLVSGALVLLAAVFLVHNRVSLNVNVKVQRRPAKPVNFAKLFRNDRRAAVTLAGIKVRPLYSKALSKDEKTIYDFERDDQGWELPLWEKDKPDHVATYLKSVEGAASRGKGSIELYADFPGGGWTGALAEISQFLNLSEYDAIAVDVYVPPSCPPGLRAKIILTVGDDWQFVEMARGIKLSPGKWTTLSASLAKGSTDWRRTRIDNTFREDVRKIAVRVESEKARYSGPIYIDNVRVHIPRK